MANPLRRLILKPPDTPPDRLSQLADALSAAVEAQTRLAAKSPHVLQLIGPLQQDDLGFFVEHEPATPLPVPELFDPAAPLATEEQLLQITAALLDALAVAHSAPGGRPVLHGGLCPGVLLKGEDGLFKVADFGVAPAVCKTLGEEHYANLAAGPHPAGSGAWEVLGPDVMDRDDRLCAFIDPDKYGQETLTSFEPGSDVIAAGLILRVMAEHKHPYLMEAEAHRVVDMARMMGFGVPVVVRRKELRESANPAVRAWIELVAAMTARLPGERPPAADLAGRLRAAGFTIDLDAIKARRWLAQLEAALQAQEWARVAALLTDRPTLERWPDDVQTRAAAIDVQLKAHQAEERRRAAIEAEHRTAAAWLSRIEALVQTKDWRAAARLLHAKPQLAHWPDEVTQALTPLAATIREARAVQNAGLWEASLRKAVQAQNWVLVGKRLAYRPPLQQWPADIQEYVAGVEQQYRERLAGEERLRQRIAKDHQEARTWLQRAQALVDNKQWEPALDLLAVPPQVEHWPASVRETAGRLVQDCRARLGEAVAADLEASTASVLRAAEAIVRDVLGQRLAGLLGPARVETKVDYVLWAPEDSDADGRSRVTVRLRPPAEVTAPEPLQCDLDFRRRDREIEFCRGQDEFARRLADELGVQVAALQGAQLGTLQRELREGVFPAATVRAVLTGLQPRVAADVALLGADASEEPLRTDLLWNDSRLAWALADPAALAAQALKVATAATQRVIQADLLARSAVLRDYKHALSIELAAKPVSGTGLPRTLTFEARLGVRIGPRGGLQALDTLPVTCPQVGKAVSQIGVGKAEARLTQLLVEAQEQSRDGLLDDLEQRAKAAAAKVKIGVQPKRSKTPVDQATYEIKPKGGSPLNLAAKWNPRTFAYELPAGWDKTYAALLRPAPPPPPPKPTPVVPPKPAPAAPSRPVPAAPSAPKPAAAPAPPVRPAKPAEERPAAAPPSKPAKERPAPAPQPKAPPRPAAKRRGVVIGAALGVVAVAAVGLYFGLHQGVQPPGPQPEPQPETQPEKPPEKLPEHPVQPERPTLQAFLQARLTDAAQPALETLLPVLIPAAAWQQGEVQDRAAYLGQVAQPRAALSGTPAADDESAALQVQLSLKDNPKPCVATFQLRRSDADWVPDAANVDALAALARTAEEALRPAVVVRDLPQELRQHLQTQLGVADLRAAAVDKLLELLVPAGGEVAAQAGFLAQVAQPSPGVSLDHREGDAAVAVKVQLALKFDPTPREATFRVQPDGQAWRPDAGNTAGLDALYRGAHTALLSRIKDAAKQIDDLRRAGNLPNLYAAWDAVGGLADLLPDAAEVKQLRDLMARVPPRWADVQAKLTGYTPADEQRDAGTGYPQRLKAADGAVLLLVSAPPADELWKELGKVKPAPGQPLSAEAAAGEAARAWQVFYVDAQELAAAGTFDQAQQLAAQHQRALPTRSQWVLAALKLRGGPPPDLFGGRREWCADDADQGAGDEHWVCGGCTLTVKGQKQALPAPPAKLDNLPELWQWLNQPLVMQRRSGRFGDGLTAVRTVLAVHAN